MVTRTEAKTGTLIQVTTKFPSFRLRWRELLSARFHYV